MTSILITRPAGAGDPLVALLQRRRYRVHAVPTVLTETMPFDAGRLAACDWIVVTSVQGVNALSELPTGPRFAAVGAKTAGALRARGVEPAHVPAEASGAALAASMPAVDGTRVVVVRASAAADDLPELLRKRGAAVEEITAYRTLEGPATSSGSLRTALADPDLAAVVFASGSAARGFVSLGGSTRYPAITIGPRTTAVARGLGFDILAEAEARSAESLADAITAAIPMKETRDA